MARRPRLLLRAATMVFSAHAAMSKRQGAMRRYSTLVPRFSRSTIPADLSCERCLEATDLEMPISAASSQTHRAGLEEVEHPQAVGCWVSALKISARRA
jgi:hypothetical protein